MDGLEIARELWKPPESAAKEREGEGEQDHDNGTSAAHVPPVDGERGCASTPVLRMYPLIPPALPEHLKRRRKRTRSGGDGR